MNPLGNCTKFIKNKQTNFINMNSSPFLHESQEKRENPEFTVLRPPIEMRPASYTQKVKRI